MCGADTPTHPRMSPDTATLNVRSLNYFSQNSKHVNNYLHQSAASNQERNIETRAACSAAAAVAGASTTSKQQAQLRQKTKFQRFLSSTSVQFPDK